MDYSSWRVGNICWDGRVHMRIRKHIEEVRMKLLKLNDRQLINPEHIFYIDREEKNLKIYSTGDKTITFEFSSEEKAIKAFNSIIEGMSDE